MRREPGFIYRLFLLVGDALSIVVSFGFAYYFRVNFDPRPYVFDANSWDFFVPTRLPRPWDSPGKNTGVGCHFPLQCRKVKSESEVTQSCLTVATPRTAAYQAPPSMGFSRQEYWSGVPLLSPAKQETPVQFMDQEDLLEKG